MNSWRMRNVSWLIFWGLHRSSLASIPGRDSFAILPRLFLLIALLAQVFIDKSYSRRIDDVEKVTTHGTRSLNRIDDFTRHFWIRCYFFSAEIRKIFTHYCGIVECFVSLLKSLSIWDHMMPIWLKRWINFEVRKACALICIRWRKARYKTGCERHKTKLVINTADRSAILICSVNILLKTVVYDLFADLK